MPAAGTVPDDPGKVVVKGSDDSGTQHGEGQDAQKPIVINWEYHFEIGLGTPVPGQWKGKASLTLNPDGSYNFAGAVPAIYQTEGTSVKWYCEFALVLGVKSSEGSVILFPYSGSLLYGKVWNKQGTNKTIKDNWNAFVKAHNWKEHLGYQSVFENSPLRLGAPVGGLTSGPS